jgi:hypothetical protein
MEWFDDFFPDWDDLALAAAMGEEFAEDRKKFNRCFIDETFPENEEDDEDQI